MVRYGLGDSSASSSSSSEGESTTFARNPSPQKPRPSRNFRSALSAVPAAPTTPFAPAPVHLTQPRPKRGQVVQLDSSDEEDSDSGASRDDSGRDSEDEAWPVGPIGSIGVRGWRRSSDKGKGKAKNQSIAESQRIFGGADEQDIWDAKEKAAGWANANLSYHRSLSRAVSASPPPQAPFQDPSVQSIESLLASLALAQSESQTALVASFDARNSALWNSIENSIRAAEQEEGEKNRVLEEQRRKGEEAERKAKEMREMELKRKAEEKVELERRTKEEEGQRAQKAAEDKTKRELAAKIASERAAAVAEAEGESPQADWERWNAKMTEIKTIVLPIVSQNPLYRKACYAAKRAITPKIGQLTSSSSATSLIIERLDETLNSMRPPVGQEAQSQPYIWTLNHLSKALVKQAETEITAKLGTAYPLGRVVIGLLARGHTELGDVLMARLVKKCFWITGWWPPKRADQTAEEHEKTLGHAPRDQNEAISAYALRMSGLVALYASILQTSPLLPPQGPCPLNALSNIPPHFRPSAGWRWLVLILRPPLVTLEPTPLLLVTFLEIAGETMGEVYGRQWWKFLEVMLREGVREGKAGFAEKAKSGTMRVLLWLEEWEKTGRVEKTPGKDLDP
ncbi:nucleoporin GLE1, partial [Phenoliferia sp. Uapishka_3]